MLVSPCDVDGLAKALIDLATDERLRERLGSNARLSVEKDYSWERVIEANLDIYDEVVGLPERVARTPARASYAHPTGRLVLDSLLKPGPLRTFLTVAGVALAAGCIAWLALNVPNAVDSLKAFDMRLLPVLLALVPPTTLCAFTAGAGCCGARRACTYRCCWTCTSSWRARR